MIAEPLRGFDLSNIRFIGQFVEESDNFEKIKNLNQNHKKGRSTEEIFCVVEGIEERKGKEISLIVHTLLRTLITYRIRR